MHNLRCRVCRERLPVSPCLHYRNMPGSAQAFPDRDRLVEDCGAELRLYECEACGVVQLAASPVPYYREVIRAAAYSEEMREFRVRQFVEWTERYALAGRSVLEVGCGRGEYLSLLKASGVDTHGLEYSAAAVNQCRRQGLSAKQGYLTRRTGKLAGAPFEAFVCLSFMEHWPDPVGSLMAMARNLTSDGVGLVEVPNFDMIVRRALFSEFIADHLLYFTAETLRFTLQRGGFEVLSCRSVWHDYILSAEIRRRPALNIGPLVGARDRIASVLHQFIDQFPLGEVAIWGAGHQALSVIALADLGPRIRYVIDSAPFKQGRYTPASHLPIVSPDALSRDAVQAVIVMAASYSDEVARQLRAHFSPELKVAILREEGLESV